ncbi:AbrB/MazE/SpoVT family DNA-binding domain-containing protein [Candidatus Pacearchaeota archaeon]|nr:AbrB/MazE/SpoVT family DNA-binding domain-containing protein [Candidatus Pacearchaeota archaeon]
MAEATYHKEKLYIPKKVRQDMNLENGDTFHVEVKEDGKFIASRIEGVHEERYMDRALRKPLSFRIKRPLTREAYYED